MQTLLVTTQGLGGYLEARTATKPTATPATKKATAASVSNDELLAGARLQWSAMFAIDPSYLSVTELESTTFRNLANRLRAALEAMGLQNVQFGTVNYSYSIGSEYRGKLVAEFTTPINRRLKADLRWDVEQLARQVGLMVDPNPAHNNIRIVRQGSAQTGQAIAPVEPGLPTFTPTSQGAGDSGLNSFLTGVGVSTPWLLVAGALALVVFLKR